MISTGSPTSLQIGLVGCGDAVKARILELLTALGLQRSDDSEFVRLRKIRGQLLRRPRSDPVQVVAAGRPDWIGWVELKTEPVDELAIWQ